MFLRASRIAFAAAVVSAAFVAGCEGCDQDPPGGNGRASITVRFPGGSTVQSDGASRLSVVLNARNEASEPDDSAMTITAPSGFVAAVGEAFAGGTLTGTPDANGAFTFEYGCVPNANEVVPVTIENATGTKATANINCATPEGEVIIQIDTEDCDGLRANNSTKCAVGLNIFQRTAEADLLKTGPVTVSVADATPLDPLTNPNEAVLLTDVDSTVAPAAEVVVNVTDGIGGFAIKAPLVAQTVSLAVTFEGTTVRRDVVIAEFVNLAAVTFNPAQLNITGGTPATVTIQAQNDAGAPDAGGLLNKISIEGNLAGATIAAGGGAAAEVLTDVALDNDGRVVLTVNTPAVLAPEAYTVIVEYAPLPDFGAITANLPVTANIEGALLLNLEASPTRISSDGNLAERRSNILVSFTQDGQRVPGGTVTVAIPTDSIAVLTLEGGVNSLTLDDTDFDAQGKATVVVEAQANVPSSTARVVAAGTVGNPATDVDTEVFIDVVREPILQTIQFETVEPSTPIGVLGGSLPSTAVVTFKLIDDSGLPMPNVRVDFAKNDTADPLIGVGLSDISDNAGLVTTVLSAGTIPGPVTIIATARIGDLVRTGQSNVIPIIAGLPSFETSYLECDDGVVAVASPYSVACEAVLVDRFSNEIDGLFVQFAAEGASETAAITSSGGVAAISINSTEEQGAPTDVLGWSYGAVLPLDISDIIPSATFDIDEAEGCFDNKLSTPCNLLDLCSDPNNDIFCPLPPSCLADGLDARAVLQTPPTPRQIAEDPAQRARLRAYIDDHRACGFPVGCYTGDLGGLAVQAGDECPANIGCFDFTTSTECPQDGVRTIMASTRGAEAFSDLNGNGIFDFDDQNGNGRHDEGDTLLTDSFVDLPEPFLDRNDNCFRDDLTNAPRFETTPILQVVNTDQFSDVDGNDVFGFDSGGVVTETNGFWDQDTQIFLSERVLELDGVNFAVGEPCDANEVDTVITCQSGQSALCIETSGGFFAAGCDPPNLNSGGSATVAFRWTDANANCPSIDLADEATILTTGPIEVGGDTFVELDEAACGYGEEFNPLLPHCAGMPFLGAPVLQITVAEKCTTEVEPTNATIEFSTSGKKITKTLRVNCP